MKTLTQMGLQAKEASRLMAVASTEQKNRVLKGLMAMLQENQQAILQANQEDVRRAESKGLHPSLIDRLSLQGRLGGIVNDISHVISLRDPIGESFDQQTLPNGLEVVKRRIPIGVLGVIYESRPNVTLDITALAVKSGNCAILRGGSETVQTNLVLVDEIQRVLKLEGLPAEALQLVPGTDRALVKELLHLHESIDLIIPRGSAELQKFCRENSKIPVITGGVGICHLFVDETADLEKSLQVILNAKVQRPTVCNALNTLLVHEGVAKKTIPMVVKTLREKGVSFRLDPKAFQMAGGREGCLPAGSEDWSFEWLSLILGIKVVSNLEEAIAHIRQHGTSHSDGILTEDPSQAEKFIHSIDSAAVYVNASTRFTD